MLTDKNNYILINKNAYDALADEYLNRTEKNDYLIKDDCWYKILEELITKENTEVLEVGPGSGRILNIFDQLGCRTTAVELSPKMSEFSKKKSPNTNVITGNILNQYFTDNSFDIIFLMAVIHNFPKKEAIKLLDKIYKWLKINGFLVIITTIHEKEYQGFTLKEDYNKKVTRFRYQYTKKSFDKLLKDSKYNTYKKCIIEEKDRNKTWYNVICKK